MDAKKSFAQRFIEAFKKKVESQGATFIRGDAHQRFGDSENTYFMMEYKLNNKIYQKHYTINLHKSNSEQIDETKILEYLEQEDEAN
jgi:hypothetical protein